jgi:hypothetical protein
MPAPSSTQKYNRYVGYDDEDAIREVITKLYIGTKSDGLLIQSPIAKPSNVETSRVLGLTNLPNDVTQEYVYDTLVQLVSHGLVDFSKYGYGGKLEGLAETIYSVLEDAKLKGSLSSMLKSSLSSFLCWFVRFNTYRLTNVLYMGTPSKNEVYWLYIMNSMGCTVNTVSFVDDNADYLRVDTKGKYSNLIMGTRFEPLTVDFKSIRVDDYLLSERVRELSQTDCSLKVNRLEVSSPNSVETELCSLRSQRLGTSDGTTESTYFVLLAGFDDEDSYRNMLFNLRKNITNSAKPLVFIENGLDRPSYDEGLEYYGVNRNDPATMLMEFVDRLVVPTSKDRTVLAKRKFLSTMSRKKGTLSTNALFGMCVNVSVWFKQCMELIDFTKSDVPTFYLYGNPTEHDYTLMEMLSAVGFDVLIACPDKQYLDAIKAFDSSGTMQTIEYHNSSSIKEFPRQLVRAKVATTAYNASRDLDNILYNDGCMFRDRHYTFCQTVTLKTTFDEINILWNEESKYRPGFASDENSVTVPNIFAKLDGIPMGDSSRYVKDIQGKLTPNSMVYYTTPFYRVAYGMNDFSRYFMGVNLDLAKIKLDASVNKYTYLPDHVQDLILYKMQEVINSGYLRVQYPDIMHLTLKVGTTLPMDALRLIQSYDFTKEIPKLVVVHANRNPFSVYECIYLLLMNFLGFDILVYTPTGYKNIETYLDPRAFEQYDVGEYKYDFSPPRLKVPKAKKSNGFGFFRKKTL